MSELDATSAEYATQFVESVIAAAIENRASDIHFQPTASGLSLSWRLDGVLQSVGDFPAGKNTDVVSRLKVLAELLTYRNEIPQEGRIRESQETEIRVSTFPTLHGERAVVRLFANRQEFDELSDLGLDDEIVQSLKNSLLESSGVLLITGPAGSGKTTTGYACLREILKESKKGRCIVSIEDPIETSVPSLVQSQVNESAGFDLETGLRSVLRQDPEVIFVGEIRDSKVAQAAFQACLTGHLVVTTFHAGSSVEAITRLLELGVEPYALRSGVLAILNQRLVRKFCDCRTSPLSKSSDETGCPNCFRTGFRNRMLLAEHLEVKSNPIASAISSDVDSAELQKTALDSGFTSILSWAKTAMSKGETSERELRRVFGKHGSLDFESG